MTETRASNTALRYVPVFADIDSDFKQNLQILVPMVLSPENLVLKRINGQKVKARDLIQYFKSYIQIYSGNELPEPKSMLVVSCFSIYEFYPCA